MALELSLIGGFAARIGGSDLRIASRRGRALLALLALEPGRRMTRDRVAVMGAAGKDFVFKDEMRGIAAKHAKALADGATESEANHERDEALALCVFVKQQARYERGHHIGSARTQAEPAATAANEAAPQNQYPVRQGPLISVDALR